MTSDPVLDTERRPARRGRVGRYRPSTPWVHLPLIIGAVLMVTPFLWMLSTTVKDTSEVFAVPTRLIPKAVDFSAFGRAFHQLGLGRALINSLVVTVSVTAIAVLTSSMAAYALARLDFPGRRMVFLAILSTMMIPLQTRVIPEYIAFSWLGWIDTYLPLILPGALNSAFGVFLMRQYFATLPRETDEAAELDGAGPWRTFWFVLLPQTKPAMGALALFTFLATWNDFFSPLIFLTSKDMFTVPLAVAQASTVYGTDWPLLMSGSCIAMAPTVLTFVILRRYIVSGVAFTGSTR